ncbi:AfsR/SARP family transcriptional regulator [Catenuloplanes indicus]|uniref:ATPase/DNA-binding SARP family transcriptional activator n=1 Tax=Catenuloplanes indicus TaxID=137267 RepID=A0AAE3VUZ2_9ACTN|nr:BTAD domain-containing putative transcriptional regulator [Catenuloplanes indicus]MDQ0364179.1 putative ATPase/DNA-binding SARP family transcriptional activator [Catenuloplanes indicus]
MRFGILGPVRADGAAGRAVPLGGARLRALLAMLLLDAGRPVPAARLIDGVYGDRPPAGAGNALQSQISRLRAVLPVEHDGGGYRLAIDPDEVDAHRFARLAAAGRDALAAGEPARAVPPLREALALWRGEPLADVRAAPFADAQVTRLTEARRFAAEDLAEAELSAGAPRAVIGPLRDLVVAAPLRERAWALLMRALAADGRPAEALAAFETARRTLADTLGADPSPDLSALHTAILRGTPVGPAPAGSSGAVSTGSSGAVPAGFPGVASAGSAGAVPAGSSGPASAESPDAGPAGSTRPVPAGPPGTADADAVPSRADGADRHGVPAQLTSFVGRDNELRAVAAALAAGRLVTLHGPGGSGKTRLAVETATRYPGAVRFVELAAATAPDVPRAVSDAIGLRDTGLRSRDLRDGGPSVTDRLIAALTTRDVLLVLDNCEHVIAEAAALASRLLTACPGVRILATSREPLGLTGEVLRPVGGLPEQAAVRLFLDRAALVDPGFGAAGQDPGSVAAGRDAGFTVAGQDPGSAAAARDPGSTAAEPALGFTARPNASESDTPGRLAGERLAEQRRMNAQTIQEQNAAAIRAICRTLDGLPLALELAAARLQALPVSEVAARVGDRFRLLNRGSRTAPERQRTLRAVVEWSWELLSEPERALARRFTVFRGGCALDAVEGVCGPDAVGLLADLVGKSLIERDGDRYRMLETIRAFCTERLAESGEEPAIRAAHAAWFLTVAQAADRELRTGRQLSALRRLDVDRDNLHAALRDADVRTGLRLLAALSFYWWLRGLRTEAADLARMLLERQPEPEPTEEYALCELTARLGATGTGREPAPYLTGITRPPAQPFLMYLSAIVSGPPAGSLADVQTVHVHLRNQLYGDPWSEALGAIGAGWMVLLAGGTPAQAEPEFVAALAGFRALGERWGTMLALNGLFEMASARGDQAVAEQRMAEAMRLAGELGSTVDTADLLRSRADSRLLAGDLDGAAADLIRTAELARGCGAPELLSAALLGLGRLALRRGDRAEARRLCREALSECPVGWYGSYGVRVTALAVLGRIAAQDGDDTTAGRLFREVFMIVPGPDGLPALGEALHGLIGAAVRSGAADRAAVLLGASTTLLIGSATTGAPRTDASATSATGTAVEGRDPGVVAEERNPGFAGEEDQAGTVRDMLGDAAYREAHARGARLTRAEAIAYVIGA